MDRDSPWDEDADADLGSVDTFAVAWFPAGDYEQAMGLWPDFAESDLIAGPDGLLPHPQYCRAMQQKLIEIAEAGVPTLLVAPVRVAPFTAWCAEHDEQPDSAEARAAYAAHLAVNGDPGLVVWPPDRNQVCWCGSGRKYKKCCAATSVVDDAELRR